jgi:hypothetical protein
MLPICGHGPKRGNGLGFTVLRIKEDGGCYEVYALNEKANAASSISIRRVRTLRSAEAPGLQHRILLARAPGTINPFPG